MPLTGSDTTSEVGVKTVALMKDVVLELIDEFGKSEAITCSMIS